MPCDCCTLQYKFRHEHRQWVTIVGEDHELLEWDAPDLADQGTVPPPHKELTHSQSGVGGPTGLAGDEYPFYEGFQHRGVR